MATHRATTVNSTQTPYTGGSSWGATRTIVANDLAVFPITWEDAQTLTGVTDSAGGTWGIAIQLAHGSGAPEPIGAIAYCLSHPGGTGVVITGAFSGSANAILEADVMCFQPGAGNTFVLDGTASGVGSSATFVTSGAITTTGPGVVVQFLSGFQLTATATAGGTPAFTRDTPTENVGVGRSFAQYLLSGSAQTVTPGCSWAALGAKYVLLAAAFKEVAAAVADQPPGDDTPQDAAGPIDDWWNWDSSAVGPNAAPPPAMQPYSDADAVFFFADPPDDDGELWIDDYANDVDPPANADDGWNWGEPAAIDTLIAEVEAMAAAQAAVTTTSAGRAGAGAAVTTVKGASTAAAASNGAIALSTGAKGAASQAEGRTAVRADSATVATIGASTVSSARGGARAQTSTVKAAATASTAVAGTSAGGVTAKAADALSDGRNAPRAATTTVLVTGTASVSAPRAGVRASVSCVRSSGITSGGRAAPRATSLCAKFASTFTAARAGVRTSATASPVVPPTFGEPTRTVTLQDRNRTFTINPSPRRIGSAVITRK